MQGECGNESGIVLKLVEQNTKVGLNFDGFELDELEVGSIDWCLEAAR
jgi:hypothetical protein